MCAINITISELRAFLGLDNYYGRFFKNLNIMIHPLNWLLQKNVKFECSEECENTSKKIKEQFKSTEFLAHYDSRLPLVLSADASPYRVSAILSHVYLDGSERVIQYAS